MIAMIYGVAIFVFAYLNSNPRHHYYQDDSQVAQFSFWDPKLFAEVALGTIVVIFLGSTYKTMALSGGGSAVAESLGGDWSPPTPTIRTNANCSTSLKKCPSLPAFAHAASLCA